MNEAVRPTLGDYIAQYLKLRAKKKELEDEADKALQPYKQALAQIENHFLAVMNDQGLDNLKAAGIGIAYKSTVMQVKVEDRAQLVRFVMSDPAAFDIFTNALAKEYIKAFVEENHAPPPGVVVSYLTNINVRRDS